MAFKKNLRLVAIALIVLSGLAFSYFRIFDLYELQTYDWRCRIRGPRPLSKDIVFVDIWNDTLEQFGAWPFDRAYHADLIKVLSYAGVKAVVLDILFIEPKEGDEEVVKAAKDAGNVYFVEGFLNPKPKDGVFVSEKALDPLLPAYREAAAAVGHVNRIADVDGKTRRTYPFIQFKGRNFYPVSLQVAMKSLGVKENQVSIRPGHSLDFGNKFSIPLDDENHFIVNFAGTWEKSFKHYSYYEVIAAYLQQASGQTPRLDLKELRGKICYVGLTSAGSHDVNPIPIQPVYPMVGMHANILNNVLMNDYIRRLDRWGNMLVLALLALLFEVLALRLRPFRALFASLAALGVFIAAASAVFAWGFWIDLFYPVVLSALIYTATTLSRVLHERKKRELIEGELKIASQIQKSFLPEKLPSHKGLDLAVYMKPAKAVGGDLYAFTSLPGGRLGVMVGDVSGKGTPAALFMAKVVSEFKFSAREKEDPAEAVARLNDSIASESTGGLFVTLTYVVFDLSAGKFTLCNGGHLPVVRVGKNGSDLITSEEGMPIGVMEGVPFGNLEQVINEGDCFAFYSDGVSEARNRKKEEFGIEALQKVIAGNRTRTAAEILEAGVAELNRFMGKAEQHDDITLLIVKAQDADAK